MECYLGHVCLVLVVSRLWGFFWINGSGRSYILSCRLSHLLDFRASKVYIWRQADHDLYSAASFHSWRVAD